MSDEQSWRAAQPQWSWPRIFLRFILDSAGVVSRGNGPYYAWIVFLLLVIGSGVSAYANQVSHGLITTHMRDQVSWGFYIGNFAFLVGVAAAAVVLVIPAYIYNWGPIRDVVLLAEILSVAAIVMCILFVTVDVGRPHVVWHMMPGLGTPNFPHSMLMWDVLVLSSYFLINYFIVTYLLYMGYTGQKYNANFIMPIIFLSIPMAVGIHSVTAMLFMGLKARAFWHTAILAPRFLSSAFCSGPALLVLIFLVLRKIGRLPVSEHTLFKVGELLAYAMAVNLFFLGVEVFTEFYGETAHSIHAHLQWFGTHERKDIAIYSWTALACNFTAFIGFMVPVLRRKLTVLVGACILAIGGVFVEKGLGLLLPGMTPDVLGETYTYNPSLNEVAVAAGVWAIGALLFTAMVKVALSVTAGTMRFRARSVV
ncbi:MAG: polysulfide reductase NrfD [Myxococcales bacterium]|nr:polysulfide reductase NrfD [Myxococcales bacterium]MDH5565221.1 polysulfide reductase NrfD [Myxococcales bacterium]